MQKKLKRRKRTLTPKQLKLCENFIKFNDKEKAYRVSGYKGNGNHKAYIEKLFDKPEVKDYIKQLRNNSDLPLLNLSETHQFFVKEYLKDFNGSRAYKASISPELEGPSLWQAACSLLKKPEIRKALQEEVKARFERLDIEGDLLIRLLFNIADNDPADLFNDSKQLKSIKDMPIEIRKALRSFKVVEHWKKGEDGAELETIKDVTVCSREKAIELLMKYKGMLIEQHNIKGRIDHNVKAGVMLVPGMLDEDNWLKAVGDHATYQQKLLEENNANSDS